MDMKQQIGQFADRETTWLPFESTILGLFLSASLMTDIPDNGDLLWNAGGGVSFGFHR